MAVAAKEKAQFTCLTLRFLVRPDAYERSYLH